jgi:dTDP-4-amino-4,6-dideoxygalactose transaminase
MSNAPIAFIDLKAQQAIIRDKIDAAIARVLDRGGYILGKEVGEFEAQLTVFPVVPGGVPISDVLSKQVFNLPTYPYLDADTQGRIVDAVKPATC